MRTCPECRGYRYIDCPVCNGTGKDPRGDYDCTYCDGNGKKVCNVCDGTGSLDDNDDYRG